MISRHVRFLWFCRIVSGVQIPGSVFSAGVSDCRLRRGIEVDFSVRVNVSFLGQGISASHRGGVADTQGAGDLVEAEAFVEVDMDFL